MKITSTKEGLLFEAEGDYIVSKGTMFDCREFKGHMTIHGFSGCVGQNQDSILHLAEYLGYSKFQTKCIKLLLKIFNRRFEKTEKCFVDGK